MFSTGHLYTEITIYSCTEWCKQIPKLMDAIIPHNSARSPRVTGRVTCVFRTRFKIKAVRQRFVLKCKPNTSMVPKRIKRNDF